MLLNRRVQLRVETALAPLRRAGLRRVHEMAATTVDRMPSADLVARLTSDVDQVTTFLQGGGIQFLTNGAQLIIALAIMVAYSWPSPWRSSSSRPATGRDAADPGLIASRYDQARRDLSRLQSRRRVRSGGPVVRSPGTRARPGNESTRRSTGPATA